MVVTSLRQRHLDFHTNKLAVAFEHYARANGGEIGWGRPCPAKVFTPARLTYPQLADPRVAPSVTYSAIILLGDSDSLA